MINNFDFTGKKILVTGASSGIGQSTAIRLSEQGAQVIALGRNIERLEETRSLMKDGKHRLISIDFNEIEDMTELYADIMDDGVKLNGLVHCAGIASIIPLNIMKKNKIEECMNVNFYSFIELVKQFSKKKNHVDNSTIVGVSAIAAMNPIKCQTIYAASKAAMNVAVQALAYELVDKKIRINTVMPGITETKMAEISDESFLGQRIMERTSSQLLGITQPESIAGVIMFLLSDISNPITGRAIYADGGLFS